MFDNSSILVTGGTGSFGQSFVAYILKNFKPQRLIVFSRDEMKQWEMAKKISLIPHFVSLLGTLEIKTGCIEH